ncbi:hypothetical protein DVJ78_07110 [Humibacter sp. BT305]|uniref:Uncharacterized protein n=1 Tax=Cnuibacter physcomitrellae TaxID=1619308 RepID=A0A1X9LQB7_9MICO|nr:hypothetical protein B5808_13545 [Cnuibacter physcomitrellae]AXH35204.1 hypothetical protein DVJ78_07110 [Humibacter sp. BT305]GGI37288.1 hypothetical protein GCM10010988_13200 [Cnuibacter physcomitrellae]
MDSVDGTVSSYGVHKFGRDGRPRIREVYAGAGGWHPLDDGPERLTVETAEQLRGDGVTMVRVRWRMRTVEVMLRRYLGG